MMFMKGQRCELYPLDNQWADEFAHGINSGLTLKYTFTGSIPMREVDVAQEWDSERKKGSVQFSIFANGKFVGTTGLYSHRDIYRSWEFRILIIDEKATGRGIGSDATRMVVNYAFNRLNAHRIWLGVNAENEGAIGCYEKVGFKHEGRLRDEIFCQGKYVDALRMSILEKEWAVHVEA